MNPSDWKNTPYADQFFMRERESLRSGLRQAVGPKTLQIGNLIDSQVVKDLDLPFSVIAQAELGGTPTPSKELGNLVLDPAFLPFRADSWSTVVLPHVLEWNTLPHQVLREVHRVLMPEGHIVLTGFNPASCLGLQRLIRPSAVFKGHYYTPKRVMDWLQLLGFDVVASSMFQYAPLSKRARTRKVFNFMESAGDRWLPMLGGGYMIVAKKREVGVTLIEGSKFRPLKPKLRGAAAKSHLEKTQAETGRQK